MKLYTVAHEYTADVTDYYEVKAESREEAAAFVENGDGEYINNESMDQWDGHYYVIDSKEIKS
tara:strand:+ start:78 stop:266 length:189 start_codon:yes stop_codon:yes gene_type:complete